MNAGAHTLISGGRDADKNFGDIDKKSYFAALYDRARREFGR